MTIDDPGTHDAAEHQPKRSQGQLPKSRLTVDVIVAKAIELIETNGAREFSMRGLARALGVYPTALYWHVGDRADLIGIISERWVSHHQVVLPDEGVSWQDYVRMVCGRFRAAAHAFPEVARLTGVEIFSVGAPALLDRGVRVLLDAGIPIDEVADAYNAMTGALLGFVNFELSSLPDIGEEVATKMRGQVAAIDADEYPTVAAHVDRLANRTIGLRWTTGVDNPLDSSFEWFVEMLIAGVEARLKDTRKRRR